jgi:hypothetical protein
VRLLRHALWTGAVDDCCSKRLVQSLTGAVSDWCSGAVGCWCRW